MKKMRNKIILIRLISIAVMLGSMIIILMVFDLNGMGFWQRSSVLFVIGLIFAFIQWLSSHLITRIKEENK